ncbi:MAG: ABC transporter substrate-binding protein [Acidobacteriia bacterium]|nr:ABC transporter substrate-binding protein [Terriglobia bacterium]
MFRLIAFLLAGASVPLASGVSPNRIVSLSPAVTEILYGIGAFNRVVAVTDYCLYPPEAKQLPKVGGWATPSVEKVAQFHPDLVALSDSQAPFLQIPLSKLGIRTVIARSQTIPDALYAIETLGKATGTEQQAARLASEVRTALDTVRKRAATLSRPSVLCVVDHTPGTLRDLYAVTEGSFLAELIDIAGGKALGGNSRLGYAKMSPETVLTSNPEIVFDVMPRSQTNAGSHPEAAWSELPELRAVRNRKVFAVREEFIPHASQMIAKTAVLFARLIHPEVPPGDWERR